MYRHMVTCVRAIARTRESEMASGILLSSQSRLEPPVFLSADAGRVVHYSGLRRVLLDLCAPVGREAHRRAAGLQHVGADFFGETVPLVENEVFVEQHRKSVPVTSTTGNQLAESRQTQNKHITHRKHGPRVPQDLATRR